MCKHKHPDLPVAVWHVVLCCCVAALFPLLLLLLLQRTDMVEYFGVQLGGLAFTLQVSR